jgi:hypothetical protein
MHVQVNFAQATSETSYYLFMFINENKTCFTYERRKIRVALA